MRYLEVHRGTWRCMGQIQQASWSMHVQHSVTQRWLSMPTRAIMHGNWECSHEGPATNGLIRVTQVRWAGNHRRFQVRMR